mgnify:CR=1 FL=1
MEYIDFINNARAEFALSMMAHHVWVPIYIGAVLVAAILETLYVRTGEIQYKSSAIFIGRMMLPTFLFIVLLGIATPPFSEDWAQWWRYVQILDPEDLTGRIPSTLIVVTIIAFIINQTCWDRIPPKAHLISSWVLPIMPALAESSAVAVNGWMQAPHATSVFDLDTFAYVRESMAAYFLQPMTSIRFLHNFSATYLVGVGAILSLSCYFLLKNKHQFFTQKAILISSIVGVVFTISVIAGGDAQGRAVHETQPMKLASLEALWETEATPHFVLFAIPDVENMRNKYEIAIPHILGFMLSSSEEQPVKGIKQLLIENESRIRNGLVAYQAMNLFEQDRSNEQAKQTLLENHKDLGYAYLLHKYTDNILTATDADIKNAAKDTMANITFLFFSFRIMVVAGFLLLIIFSYWAVRSYNNDLASAPGFIIKASIFTLPIALAAYLLGWALSEVGRQPWIIYEVLPTISGGGSYKNGESAGFSFNELILTTIVIFTSLTALIVRQVRKGPPHLEPRVD